MMPLTFAQIGEGNVVRRVGGSPEVRRHLESLGFVAGSRVTVITSLSGNLIVSIKDTRVAISKEMARSILV